MPRTTIRSAHLETKTARAKLAQQGKPYWLTVAPGISLGYRRNAGPGSWNVRAADRKGSNWIRTLDAIADDREDADGTNVLNFWQAADKAKRLARGADADAGRPVTVDQALTDYAADLAVRGANARNATQPRHHLPPSLLAKPVSLTSMREWRACRNGLAAKNMPAATINRIGKSVKAALNLAAATDDRIANRITWAVGLAALAEADDTDSNVVLTDEQRRAVVAASYDIGPEFGLYVDVHAATGARSSQLALLNVSDLQMGREPKLMIPSSLKGRNRKARTRKPFPVSIDLALKLRSAATGRGASEPLLLRADGSVWRKSYHCRPFIEAAKAAKLPPGATIYALRHTAITRALLANVPVRLVASSFDTSVAMIEKTYSKFIADHGDAQMRKALVGADATAANVVALKR